MFGWLRDWHSRQRSSAPLTQRFRLLDDDGIVYYEGKATADTDFEPLDWAAANAGCTEIQYLEQGRWEIL